ncbi:MAG: DUF167 domain-containing protein [Acidimicrobiia bacterium]
MAVGEGSWWVPDDHGIVVAVRVTAGAPRSEVIGVSGDRLRVRIAAPAREGRANVEVERFLAKMFSVRRPAVSLRRGERSRDKSVHIAGITEPPPGLHDALGASP